MSGCTDAPQMVTVVVELNCIPVNNDVSIAKQVHSDLIDEIRVFLLHEFSVSLDNDINPAVLYLFIGAVVDDRLRFSQTCGGEASRVNTLRNECPLDCVRPSDTHISIDVCVSQRTRVHLNSDGVAAEAIPT